jgi:SAM-dependent methyltransferase
MTDAILTALVVIKALLVLAAIGYVVWIAYLFAPGFLGGPPYVPSADDARRDVAALAAFKPGEKVFDLGSGDGRVLVDAALAGCDVVGYEINPILTARARFALLRRGLLRRAVIRRADFWGADLRDADVVFVFGLDTIMERLEKKFDAELKPGARVVCPWFTLPTWKPARTLGRVTLYVKP